MGGMNANTMSGSGQMSYGGSMTQPTDWNNNPGLNGMSQNQFMNSATQSTNSYQQNSTFGGLSGGMTQQNTYQTSVPQSYGGGSGGATQASTPFDLFN